MREADVHVPVETIEAMGIDSPPADFAGSSVREMMLLSCDGPASVVATTHSEAVDGALEAAEHVEWWERLETDGDGVTYLERIAAPALPEAVPSPEERGVTIQSVDPGDGGCTVTVVGEQDALREHVSGAEAFDFSVTLERLVDFAGPSDPLDGLTGRQREVLETAHELGYYEVPREVTAEDVAEELDLDQSTVTEHLQRAEGNLIGTLLPD